MANKLTPLPPPGINLFPCFTANKPETFLIKDLDHSDTSRTGHIYTAEPDGEPGELFLELHLEEGEEQDIMRFRTPGSNGQEVMHVIKDEDSLGAKTSYRGMRGGDEVWRFLIEQGWKNTEYKLTVPSYPMIHWALKSDVNKCDKGLLCNDTAVVTMDEIGSWKQWHRRDAIYVAPGMDILLALGVGWARVDKKVEDQREENENAQMSAMNSARHNYYQS